jgi:hypothetical protein
VDHIVPSSGFAFDKYTPVATGVATGFSKSGQDFVVPYEIPGAPYNQPLVVKVEIGSMFTSSAPPLAAQTAGPNPVSLTIAHPGVTGVDFRVGQVILK